MEDFRVLIGMNNYLPNNKTSVWEIQQKDFFHRFILYTKVFNNTKFKMMTSHLSSDVIYQQKLLVLEKNIGLGRK